MMALVFSEPALEETSDQKLHSVHFGRGWGQVGVGKPGPVDRTLGYSQPHINQNGSTLPILAFNVLFEKKRLPFATSK